MLKILLFFSFFLLSFSLIGQKNNTCSYKKFINRSSSDLDTFYEEVNFIKKSLAQVKTFHYNKVINSNSFEILPIKIDTFLMNSKKWKYKFEGKFYDFFSLNDFNKKLKTKKIYRNERDEIFCIEYIPYKKVFFKNELIFIYDVNEVYVKSNFCFNSNARLYFSFKYGIVGFIDPFSNFVFEKFDENGVLELRRLLPKKKDK